MKLIIVESPNKIKSIKSYLGEDYEVIASNGHFRELNKKKGYDYETFEPIWSVIGYKTKESREKIIKNIKENSKKADVIYLATDPDREGEAIAWHIYDILPNDAKNKTKRIIFNEITKKAIIESINNASKLNLDLVHSQFTRRIFDRIIGYSLSSFVKAKLSASSAGRVQSVALLFIVERELERRSFVPTQWWEVIANINDTTISFIDLKKEFQSIDNKNNNSVFKFKLESEAKTVLNNISNEFILKEKLNPKITYSEINKPLTTDKLLQVGMTYFGWGASKTTMLAQKMFEGIEINNNHIGLITYPRTDSERLSDDFINESKTFIINNFGEKYLETKTKKVNNNSNNIKIQDAHEAIRPVNINLTPFEINKYENVDNDIKKMYELIWTITMSTFMKPAEYENLTYIFESNGYSFSANDKKILFDGYFILDFYKKNKKIDPCVFDDVKLGDKFISKLNEITTHSTQPPAYYTEASLIAALKNAGVGRPSTYATMAKIGESRGYVEKDKQKLIPNKLGIDIIELLTQNFPNIISKKFTSLMEEDLDKIALGKLDWKEPLIKFSDNFSKEIKEAYKNIPKSAVEYVGENCELCGSELIYKTSKFSQKFIACSNFPSCKYTRSILIIIPDRKCLECNSDLCKKTSKTGNEFIGCTNFPNCKYIESIKK